MKKPNNYWKDWSNFERELKIVIEKNNGKFPTSTYLVKNGYSSLGFAISRQGGFYIAAEKIGYIYDKKPSNYLKNWDNFEKELKIVIEENNGEFPTQKYLEENCYSSLRYAIKNYYGGFPAVRKKMGYELSIEERVLRLLEGT